MNRFLFLCLTTLFIFSCSPDDSDQDNVFFGDVFLQSQSDVNEFGSYGYIRISGDLVIQQSFNTVDEIVDMSPLDNLSIVDNGVFISSITNIDLLQLYMDEVGGILVSDSNMSVVSFPRLSMCTKAGFTIRDCPALQEINFQNLESIKSGFNIHNNPNLVDLDGLSSLTTIGDNIPFTTSFYITLNPSLSNLQGMSSISSNIDFFRIGNNASLVSLDGLDSLKLRDFEILFNSTLTDFCSISAFLADGQAYDGSSYLDETSYMSIANNAFNPSIQDFLDGNCSQ